MKIILFLCLLLSGVACAADLEVRIDPKFGESPLLLDSLRYRLPGGEQISVSRLSMILSGFALQRADGSWLELPGQYAWLDAAARRSSLTLHGIPAGKFRAIRFAIGPDAAANNGNPAQYPPDHPLNPNFDSLYWSWQGDYIFLALEGSFAKQGQPLSGYSYHFARDGNRTFITLAAPLSIDADFPSGVFLDMDLAVLFGSLSPARDGNSTHSRDGDPVAQTLRANLRGAFHLHGIGGVIPPPDLTAAKPLYMPAIYTPFPFRMSGVFPMPNLPMDNPLIVERVQLGERLFNERALSADGSISCASCHQAASDFSDTRPLSAGVAGRSGTRHAMPLVNLAWSSSFFWDGRAATLRAQALVPIQQHNEMDQSPAVAARRLAANPQYPKLFARAFDTSEVTPEKIGLALENYLLTLTSFDSRFDRSLRGEAILTPEETHGRNLFYTEYDPRTGQYGADCFHCHGGALFTDHQFHNNGLDDGADHGRSTISGSESDRDKFMTPSLRNVALRGPYMHDGRFNTLAQVIDHYAGGVVRSATLDPNLAKHPAGGLPLTAADKQALIAFLDTLSDPRRATPESTPPQDKPGTVDPIAAR